MFAYNINYIVGAAVLTIIALLLGISVFLNNPRSKVVRAYLFLMLSVAFWSFGRYMASISQADTSALFWIRLMHIGASFVPVFYFHIIMKIANLESRQMKLIKAGYLLACLFSICNFTPYFIKAISHNFGLKLPEAGVMYPLFVLYFFFYPAAAHYLSHKAYDKLTELTKRQLFYIDISGGLGFFGVALVFLTIYGIDIPVAGPLALYIMLAGTLFAIAATYTARLFDVELVKRRTIIFSLLYGASVGVFVALVFIAQRIVSLYFHVNRWVIPVIALFLITIFIRPLENLLAIITDKVLYQRRYDYMVTLKNAAKGMTLVTDTKKLLNLMVHLITKEIRVTGCAIYVYNRSSKSYVKEVSRGFHKQETVNAVKKDSSFVEWLVEKRQPLNTKDIVTWLQGEKLFSQRLVLKRTLEQIRVVMKKLGATVCVPSFLKGEMIGFMVLGSKLSGASYTRDDISLLSTLSNNAAIALENARMYEELQARINKLNHLYQEEHSLFIDAASAFSYAIDAKDGYTQTHTLKMTDYAFALTKELEKLMPYVDFDEHFYDTLKIASILHDIGKIGVPDQILKKRGDLTEEERAQLMKHTLIGENILHPIREIEEVFSLIRHHHENYDGTGYPDGLRGHDIPLISRIIAVANSYDTMTSNRPYRKARPKDQAIEEIRQKAGTQFDPLVVEAFIRSIKTPQDTSKV